VLKVLDLFSGIGGFSLGLERTGGFETVAFCEIEEYPRRVLAKHWPDVPCYADVRELSFERLETDGLGRIDCVVGGYPCQPFSQAGKRRGQEDDRHLWPEMYRIVASVRPRWVIAENVAGHISMGLDEVLSDLESEGYTAWPLVIPACAVDAPHRRDRVWIVAHAGRDTARPSEEFYWHEAERSERDADAANGSKIMADAVSQGQPDNIGGEKVAKCNWIRTTDNTSVGSGRGAKWRTEPDVGRVVNGVPRRVDRLKCLGNAVVPQIPEMIGYAILEAESADWV